MLTRSARLAFDVFTNTTRSALPVWLDKPVQYSAVDSASSEIDSPLGSDDGFDAWRQLVSRPVATRTTASATSKGIRRALPIELLLEGSRAHTTTPARKEPFDSLNPAKSPATRCSTCRA